jgi:hypothetical protein
MCLQTDFNFLKVSKYLSDKDEKGSYTKKEFRNFAQMKGTNIFQRKNIYINTSINKRLSRVRNACIAPVILRNTNEQLIHTKTYLKIQACRILILVTAD